MIAVDETPEKVLKVLDVDFDCSSETLQLRSPLADSIWHPAEAYRAEHGIFLWVIPQNLQEIVVPMEDSVLAVVSVLPGGTAGLELRPRRKMEWPVQLVDPLPVNRDVMVYRNFLGLARCVRIEELILPAGRLQKYAEVLSKRYSVPVTVRQGLQSYCRVDASYVNVVGTSCSVMAQHDCWKYYDSQTVYRYSWLNYNARQKWHEAVDCALTGSNFVHKCKE